ncbi:hypothetical protein B0H13DRAFT_2282463 [Mycena leptocephala]|nr:hypothetical protein B0H13DRAFT_2282463 [Mycena leptocephala]
MANSTKKKGLGVRARPPRVRSSTNVFTDSGARRQLLTSVKPKASQVIRDRAQKEMQEQYDVLTAAARRAFNDVRDIADPTNEDPLQWEDVADGPNDDIDTAMNVCDGFVASGAGGELRDTLEDAIHGERDTRGKKRAQDRRMHRDMIAKQVHAFAPQMPAIIDAYVEWGLQVGDNMEAALPLPATPLVEKLYEITLVDVFATSSRSIPMRYTDKFTTSSLGWVKTLTDLHGLPFKPYRVQQFSVAYDLYLAILRGSKHGWTRPLNCCPACMYKLEGKAELVFSMLVTADGNDSLKRVLRWGAHEYDDEGNPLPGKSNERPDPRLAGAGEPYFLSRERVDRWAKDRFKEFMTPDGDPPPRHGFVLLVADMVKSGELMGLEDLEGCERFFSRSNTMAGSIRYASAFHRLQTLSTYFAHFDTHETYTNLSKFLVDNYWQALEVLDGEAGLKIAMVGAGIKSMDEFPAQLKAELEYLRSLTSDTEEDTQQMEYYQRLVNLTDRNGTSKATATARLHARETYDTALKDVQESESKMGVEVRWLPESQEWADAAHLVSTKRYRLALMKLEKLVVQRMFELTKMNLSQTGYKLRKHIAKALQACSQAIQTALKSYNIAATAMVPPGRKLTWSEVVEYVFLSDFDLLHHPERGVEVRPWVNPAARLLMDTYFKIERAREEILRCDIEIRRLVTYIRDEREFLESREKKIAETDPGLSWAMEIMGIRDVEREIDDNLGDIVEEEQLAEELHLIYVASQD